MRELSAEAEALWRAVESAADPRGRHGGTERLLNLLVRLAQAAPPRSEAWVYAHRQLAERLVESDPWRASLLARRVVNEEPTDDAAWALLGLAQSLLGHHRFAVASYREALALEPGNPYYAHNLGHLYDVVFDRPERARPLLLRAVTCLRGCPGATDGQWVEMASSYAHALLRCGDAAAARAQMREVVRSGLAGAEHHELYQHILACTDAQIEEHLSTVPGDGRTPPRPTRRVKSRCTTGARRAQLRR